MSFANSGKAPLLYQHDDDLQIGKKSKGFTWTNKEKLPLLRSFLAETNSQTIYLGT